MATFPQFHQTVFTPASPESRDVGLAVRAAGLDWQAQLKPLFIENSDALGGIEQVDSHRAVVRSDNGRRLGVVGTQYTPAQWQDSLAWIQPIIDSGEARIISAGMLGGGSKIYVQAQLLGSETDITPGDSIFSSINFANAHDGSLEAGAGYNSTRVVCQNTMMMMAKSLAFRARHTKGVRDAIAAGALEFQAQRAATREQAERFRFMAKRRLSDKNLVRYVREVLSPGAGNDESIAVRGVDRIVELAHDAPGATPGTMWGGLNAVTYFATHERGRSEESRAHSLMFGDGGKLIERAVEVAVHYADKLPSNEQGRAAYQNHASAKAEFESLLGGVYVSPEA